MAFDTNNPSDILEAQIKLRADLNGDSAMWFMRGTQYAVVGLVATPLYHLVNGSFTRITKIAENNYQVRMLELSFYCDLKTGKPLRTFVNPFNKESCTMPHEVFGPNVVGLTLDGIQPPENFPFGELTFDGNLGPAHNVGDDLWVREESLVRMTSDNPGFGNYIYNEIVNYRGSLSEVSNPDITNASATLDYHTTSNIRPWLKMDDIVGHLESQAVGKKIASVDEFPADYLEMAQELFPEFIADPIAVLDAPPKLPG